MARVTRTSVVIPTWNGAHHLTTCLESLAAQTERDFETILVDGGSTDGTRELVEANHPQVASTTVWLPINRGFAAAANAGIRASKADVVVLLNNDTEVEPDWLAALLAGLYADEAIGMATSKIRLFDQRDALHTTGDLVFKSGEAANRGAWEIDAGQYDKSIDVFGASGAAMAVRRDLIDDIGVFEEVFESYMEDVDFAWRAQLRGWRCVFVPDAVVYHRLSATGGGTYASYRVARNRIWVIARNMPGRLVFRHAGLILKAQGRHLVKAVRAWRGAEARATLRGLAVGALTWPRMIPERRRILKRRVIDDAALEALLLTDPDRDTKVS